MRTAIKRVLKPILVTLCGYPAGRALLEFLHRTLGGKQQWHRHHPYDEAKGISTGDFLPAWLLRTGSMSDAHNSGHAGCEPSCLRRGLSSIPDPGRFSYLDVGCGKGWSLAIAAELPFRRIVGVETAPEVAAVAKANAAVLHRRYPDSMPIEVIAGDAARAVFPMATVR